MSKEGVKILLEKHRLLSMPPAVFARFVLDEERCDGCGRCVRTCPIQLLIIHDKKARSNDRYDHFRCITCQNCTAVCPKDAISIEGDYRVIKGYWRNEDLYFGEKTLPEPLEHARGLKFEEYEHELTETERVIYKRRSVRLYKKKQVEPALVKRVLEAGRFSPSAGNNQPWKFIVIQNRDVIEEINQKCKKFCRTVMYGTIPRPWMEKKTPGEKDSKIKFWQKIVLYLLVYLKVPGEVDPRALGGINAIVADPDYDTFFGAPTLIILLADKRGVGSYDLDTGICGQNMVLAAHSLGLATCWVSLIDGLQGFPKFRRKLGIAPPFEIVTSLTLGYPQGQIDNIVKREPARIEWIA
jgi:nitroreductase/Pyruvate/2-oxoacid:ferredoxin oxidoreductase delta subunit